MLPNLQLDAQADSPLYRQLYDQIRAGIVGGIMQHGERLPPTRELAGLLGLNRTTVSAAYELLIHEGYVSGHVGRGSFVSFRGEAGRLPWSDLLTPGPPAPPAAPAAEISFAASRPAEQLFPLDDFRATCIEVISGESAETILQLGSPAGYPPLRRYLLDAARDEGAAHAGDDIVITSGCQQALDLVSRALIGPGDPVVVEDPVYPGLRNAFAAGGARLIGVPVGPDGIDVEALGRTLKAERPRVLVVTSSFQNPTGATLSAASRAAILGLVREHRVVLVESDIYGELRYSGDAIHTIKQTDSHGDTILLRSFSKTAFPGLRVGWMIGPREVTRRIAEAKQWCDLHTDQLSQAVLLRFAESGRLAAHHAKVIASGGDRLRATLEACERHLDGVAQWTRPAGGMSVWLTLTDGLDASGLLQRAQREGVAYLPGRYFGVSREHRSSLRLSFAGLTPEQIERGIAVLGRLFKEEIRRVRSDVDREPETALV